MQARKTNAIAHIKTLPLVARPGKYVRGNKETENALLALLRQNKVSGWRRHLPLSGKPDFAFPQQQVAVFVDGCFWHGCPNCYTRPKTNRKFWDKKREDNMARDKRVNRQLRQRGWRVIRIWQHSLKKSPDACLNRIRRALDGGRLAVRVRVDMCIHP